MGFIFRALDERIIRLDEEFASGGEKKQGEQEEIGGRVCNFILEEVSLDLP